MSPAALPADDSRQRLLYDPAEERDACGVGLVCSIRNEASHDLIQKALKLLDHQEHRGACGCDGATGDGAGMLLHLPDAFFRAVLPFALPPKGQYGAGMLFLPQDADLRAAVQAAFEDLTAAEGQVVLGWRDVPVRSEVLGPVARSVEPHLAQVFIGQGTLKHADADAFERTLYILRRRAGHTLPALTGVTDFHIASLSSRTHVYKGMLTSAQVGPYFPDLHDPRFASALALVHARFSTNTFPRWPLAQPFRLLCHNGEINTLRGNLNGMKAREALLESPLFGDDLEKLKPILVEGVSDSMTLDAMAELLVHAGRPLPQVILMLVPEAWQHHAEMGDPKRAFFEYHAHLVEPWDGPATIPFTDGRYVGAVLDRNGLRPSRYTITKSGLVLLASESGAVDIDPADIEARGRLQPGKLFLVDLDAHRILSDDEIKLHLAAAQPYRAWLDAEQKTLADLPHPPTTTGHNDGAAQGLPEWRVALPLATRQRLFGYTLEDLRMLIAPMAQRGEEAIGSMGDDTPLAVLSDKPRPLYDYFKQLFAQVTNPPIDAIREELVTALHTYLGASANLLAETPLHARKLRLDQPILTDRDLARLRAYDAPGFRTVTLDATFSADGTEAGLDAALTQLALAASHAIADGATILVLSDRAAGPDRLPVPSLLAVGAVHHHLIRTGDRARCALVAETGDVREVHHAACLLGYGAAALNPYLLLETAQDLARTGELLGVTPEKAALHLVKAFGKGLLKVMSKMGISTLQSYQGAQIFEALGLQKALVDRCFAGTATRLEGIGLAVLAADARTRYEAAFPGDRADAPAHLDAGGRYHWRRGGEQHQYNPLTIARLQEAVRQNRFETYQAFSEQVNDLSTNRTTLRSLLELVPAATPVPLDEVEPWTAIVKRFKTGAMSYGSISQETHETLAEAMNALGGRSNTGEGGEDPERYARTNLRRSAIKQVASGRFGVTIEYLASADEIQIKMAQGAKPGEGGQLPGEKVYPWIARTRHATPYVGLISPPPHHDIYSIEDLAQLIHDLKNSNPRARVSVKLVSEVGVGTVAAGVAKARADVILISGHDGGTGASPVSSLAHAGLPWEMGLAEAHQALVLNGLRNRVALETDGHLKTGRDVAVAALLGAQEFGFSTAPLVALGCIMMRKCHLNTCPVGIATQNPDLRAKFEGEPEHVINYFHFVAEELRLLMATLGFRTVDEMVGRVDRLRRRADLPASPKLDGLDLSALLGQPQVPALMAPYDADRQDHGLDADFDARLMPLVLPALDHGERLTLHLPIRNTDRTVGTRLSGAMARQTLETGRVWTDDAITVHCTGSAGQSFGAFAAKGLTLTVQGEANDYVGKGLSGGRLVVTPPQGMTFLPEDHILIGNAALYGATSGELFVRGQAGERFAVRNSGASAVVEGVGDHGCEYMTGGSVVVLGPTGRNFGAGMSGGVAYVYDEKGAFAARRVNRAMVELHEVYDADDFDRLRALLERHTALTGSTIARRLLDEGRAALRRFVKVLPTEYRLALERLAAERAAAKAAA